MSATNNAFRIECLLRHRGQLLGLVGQDQRVDERIEVAVHDHRQVIAGEADAMVGDARLGVVVGADLLAAVAAAHLGLAVGGLGRVLLVALDLLHPRLDDRHCQLLVL